MARALRSLKTPARRSIASLSVVTFWDHLLDVPARLRTGLAALPRARVFDFLLPAKCRSSM